jgi:4-oxalocrotonate tautomerase
MPEIVVYAIEGRTLEQKRALVADITVAMVKHFQVPAENVVVQIVESSRENKAKGGVLFSDRPSPATMETPLKSGLARRTSSRSAR